MNEKTLSIIKPDAVSRNLVADINRILQSHGLKIVCQLNTTLSYEQAQDFYRVHEHRPFYDELCTYMSSGPVVVQVLEGDDAVAKNREVIGATDPDKAEVNTIRQLFGLSVGENSVHGSDSAETAREEIAFFFPDMCL